MQNLAMEVLAVAAAAAAYCQAKHLMMMTYRLLIWRLRMP